MMVWSGRRETYVLLNELKVLVAVQIDWVRVAAVKNVLGSSTTEHHCRVVSMVRLCSLSIVRNRFQVAGGFCS